MNLYFASILRLVGGPRQKHGRNLRRLNVKVVVDTGGTDAFIVIGDTFESPTEKVVNCGPSKAREDVLTFGAFAFGKTTFLACKDTACVDDIYPHECTGVTIPFVLIPQDHFVHWFAFAFLPCTPSSSSTKLGGNSLLKTFEMHSIILCSCLAGATKPPLAEWSDHGSRSYFMVGRSSGSPGIR